MIKGVAQDKLIHVIYLRTPKELVDRIDEYARGSGCKTRTRAVLQLLHAGLRNWEWTKTHASE